MTMYLEYFGLSEAPFRITPHTEFFFSGANRGATLEALIYSVVHNEGIVKVSGEVGSGKTMLCRVLMERLPANVVVVYLANPSLARDDIIFAIADELELEIPENTRPSAVIRVLQTRLIELHGNGRQVIALIDEAHAMPKETLEEIRLLSNLETSQHKLLQLVLFGQPELDEILARPDMRQLRERITQNFSLGPLLRDDIAQYLDFRMRTAGYRGPDVFSPAAIKQIASASQGLTRRINILAEKSLLAAFAEGTHQITPKQVHAAIEDSQYETRGLRLRKMMPFLAGIGVSAALAAIAFSAWTLNRETPQTPSSPATTEPGAPTPMQTQPAPTSEPSAASRTTTPAFPATAASAAIQSPATNQEPPQAQIASALRLNALTQSRWAETRQWLASTSGHRWFIQLTTASTDETGYAQQYLSRADSLLKPDRAGLYVANSGNEMRIGIIYGDFASRREAGEAIERLPDELRTSKPFPRQVRWLQ